MQSSVSVSLSMTGELPALDESGAGRNVQLF